MSTNGTKFLHFRYHELEAPGQVATRGGMTIAFDELSDTNVIEYAFAKCHRKDNFCRKAGRTIATQRLNHFVPEYVGTFEGTREEFAAYMENKLLGNPEELGGPMIRKFGKNSRAPAERRELASDLAELRAQNAARLKV